MAQQEYSAKDIQVLKGLEPVRMRPGMYIGSTGPEGLHHLIWEVVDNSIDEAMQGYANHIIVSLLPDNKVSVLIMVERFLLSIFIQRQKNQPWKQY